MYVIVCGNGKEVVKGRTRFFLARLLLICLFFISGTLVPLFIWASLPLVSYTKYEQYICWLQITAKYRCGVWSS
jgi:hypothetical protein